MFSDAAVNLFRAAKANPTATAVCCTAFGFYTVRVHYMKRTLSALEEHNRELQSALKDKKDTLGQRLAQLEEVVKKDLTHRDAFVRKMELQNVEQTRSVDRLQHALRTCSTAGSSSVAAQNAQNVLNAHQQQQQLATAPHLFKDAVPKDRETIVASGSAKVELTEAVSGPAAQTPTTQTDAFAFVVTQQPDLSSSAPVSEQAGQQAPVQQAGDNRILVVQEVDRLDQLRSRIGQVPPVDKPE